METRTLKRRVRWLLGAFAVGLLLSGITAFPLVTGTRLLERAIGEGTFMASLWPEMAGWISHVGDGLRHVGRQHPYMLYGTDWLAFAHVVIAIAFIGPLRDPVRNVWVIEFGMIACALVIPLALICGPIRGIPWFWRIIDCSFGVAGIVPLALARRYTRRLAAAEAAVGT